MTVLAKSSVLQVVFEVVVQASLAAIAALVAVSSALANAQDREVHPHLPLDCDPFESC